MCPGSPRVGGPSGLADVLDVLLDKGLVIDAFVRVSLVGIELLTVDARVVVASVDTYLHFAEAVNRLDLVQSGNAQTLGDLVEGRGMERGARSKACETSSRIAAANASESPPRAGRRRWASAGGRATSTASGWRPTSTP